MKDDTCTTAVPPSRNTDARPIGVNARQAAAAPSAGRTRMARSSGSNPPAMHRRPADAVLRRRSVPHPHRRRPLRHDRAAAVRERDTGQGDGGHGPNRRTCSNGNTAINRTQRSRNHRPYCVCSATTGSARSVAVRLSVSATRAVSQPSHARPNRSAATAVTLASRSNSCRLSR